MAVHVILCDEDPTRGKKSPSLQYLPLIAQMLQVINSLLLVDSQPDFIPISTS